MLNSQRTLKNWISNKAFLIMRCKRAGDWIRFDQSETNFTYDTLDVVWNKNTPDFLPFLQTLSPFSRFVPKLENCWANFKILSRIKDSVRTLQLNLCAKLCESSRIGRFRLKRPFCRDLLDLLANRPLPSSKNPHFQNVARCTTFLVKMSFICIRMKNDFHIKGSAPTLVF